MLYLSTAEMSLQPSGSGDSHEGTRSVTINRPVITPEPYNGEASSRWDQWIAHFDSVAQINGWDDPAHLLWLQVRLTGKAQTAWECLSQDAKSTYAKATCALRQRFEPSSKRDLYAAEFQARKRREKESWGDLADDLRAISDRAFPDLEDKAREQLSLDRFLGLIEKPTIALAVRQRHPKNLDEAVMYTLEVETHLSLTSESTKSVAAAMASTSDCHASEEDPTTMIAAIQTRQDDMVEMMKSLSIRMDQMEHSLSQLMKCTLIPPKQSHTARNRSQEPIICRKCGKEGHFAKGCAATYGQRKPGN